MSSSAQFILAWRQLLDELTYYELFGIRPGANAEEIRASFHVFCDTFHPDRHLARSEEERYALSIIFKRGTEAYVVLTDGLLRGHYDSQLEMDAGARPKRVTFSPLSRPPPSRRPESAGFDDLVRSPAAHPFARRADELLRHGDLRQAKLHLVLANFMDPGNEGLEAALRGVEAKLNHGS